MDLQRLRDETAADHERVERLAPLMNPGLTRRDYVAVLSRYYGFVKGWEDWAWTRVPEDLEPVLLDRCRSLLLRDDLAYFGEPAPPFVSQPDFSVPGTRAAFLGAMYVVEGSTLGGQYIASHVEQALALRHGEGNAYFVGYGSRTGSMWRDFQALLTAIPDEEQTAVVNAARKMFASFESCMQPPVASGALAAGNERRGDYA